MEKRLYRFAGMEFEISIPKDRMYKNEYRLAPFRVEKAAEPHRMNFEWVDELSPPKGEFAAQNNANHIYRDGNTETCYLNVMGESWDSAYIRISHSGKEHQAEVRKSAFLDNISMKMVLESMCLEHLILSVDGVMFHCSYIDIGGEAVLFTAPSGTGKSTQADLWNQHRNAEIINGDRAAIRWNGEQLMAEGIPFAGSSDHCLNRSLQIKAVVYLAQAPVTTIRRLSGYEAFSGIWKECSVNAWDTEDVDKASRIVEKLVENVPVYHLACTPDISAIEALEKELGKL